MVKRTIFWKRDCKINHITIQQFNDLIDELKSLEYEKVISSTSQYAYPSGSYSVKKEKNKYLTIAVVDKERNKFFYSTNWRDDAKNKNYGQGTDAFNAVNDRFKERTGINITKAFGSVPDIFKICVPKQFYYIDKLRTNMIISHASAIDFCSQYPSMLCGTLPDGHPSSQLHYKGTVKPTAQYPFAFYINSGHVAEYKQFDTHNWKASLLSSSLLGKKETYDGNPFLDPAEDETILMKASKFSLDEEMNHFYNLRKTDPVAKLVMNAFIGMLHTESYQSHKQAHIAAIVIARSNNRMMELAEIIGIENILHLCVDGCIYQGLEKYGGEIKALKMCYQEFYDTQFKMIGMNSYIAMKEGQVIKYKHGAYDMRSDGKDIEKVTCFEDMNFWRRRTIKEEILNG